MTAPASIVTVANVSKRFVLHKDKSIKERLLNVRHARRHRDDFWALRDLTLDVPIGSTLGLVGHNGSGKSTLLKVIGGIIQPTEGQVRRRGRMAALLELGAGFHPDLTGRDNVYLNAAILGLSKAETSKHFDAIVDFSGIEEFIDTQVKFYSSGMYVRLAFAVAVHVDPDLLLVDEVLAVGDEPFQRKCMDKITQFQNEGRTIILVSHSADQVGALCDQVAVLQHGSLQHFGNTADGLRVLRRSFADEQERRDIDTRFATSSSHGIHASGVTVTADAMDVNGSINPGAKITIAVEYEITRIVDPWVLGLAIETPLGHPVYRMNSTELGVELPSTPGTYRYEVELLNQNFGSGSYGVSLGMAWQQGGTITVLNPAANIEVADYGVGRGVVRLDTNVSNTQIEI